MELPENTDALKLYREALAQSISIVPGLIFSASGRFRNCIRISCGNAWSDAIIFAILIVVLVFRPNGLLGMARSQRA